MSVGTCIAITGVILASYTCGFLLEAYTRPCRYSYYGISCYGNELTSIPVFNLTRYADVCMQEIELDHNKLTSIENDAFAQLRSLNCSYRIRLSDNNISQIQEYAFRGIEAHIEGLHLDKNSLNSLPEALGSICNLKWLYLHENPLLSLNPSVMAKIGHSITNFSIGITSFHDWPTELHFLNELQGLYLTPISFQFLDSCVFRGLTNMRELIVERSNFTKISNALCALPALKELLISKNYLLNESKSDVFEPCSHITGTPNVETIVYSDNRVDFFPNIFTMFPSVRKVYMGGNGMRFMNADKFVDNFSLLTLDLSYNLFRQIPMGLNTFKSLNSLLLIDNVIEFIEDNDLIGLRNLTKIDLEANPIQFITNKAFQNNMKLTDVSLAHTFLTTIPAAVTMLPALHGLSLKANSIECTCEMAGLKHWNVSSIIIDEKCYQTNERIDVFIRTYINAGRCSPVLKR